MNNGSGTYLNKIVIEAHLALSLQKDIDLFQLRMRVPITGFLPRFIGCHAEANDLRIQFMINHPSALFVGLWHITTKVITPRIHWSKFSDAVVRHL
jgi:hypothetical protein